jgi:glycine oxidase
MPATEVDTVVVGDGLIGLTCALACADAGSKVVLLGTRKSGTASIAAAGMLAPSVDTPPGSAGHFAFTALDIYPEYVSALEKAAGLLISSDFGGLLELKEPEDLTRRTEPLGDARLLSPGDLRALEPGLHLREGVWALLHSRNGWIDNRQLVAALRSRIASVPSISYQDADAAALEFTARAGRVRTTLGVEFTAAHLVLCAGAWTPGIAGLPRTIPVIPLRGQMLSVQGVALNHVLIAGEGYAVPRSGGAAYLGSTMEKTGFVAETTEKGIAEIRNGTIRIAREFGTATETERWSGLRPITPDLLPIIGRDPAEPRLIHASGHGRNGILLAPLTAACVAALVTGGTLPADISPFAISRFA